MGANRAYFCMGFETLRRVLKLPEDVAIVGVKCDMNDVLYTREFKVFIETPDLPELEAKAESPCCSPSWEYLDGTVVFKEWWD